MDNTQLYIARAKSFVYEAGSMVVVALAGLALSPEFQLLITEHFGKSLIVSTAVLALTGVAKHLRNKQAIGALGGDNSKPVILL